MPPPVGPDAVKVQGTEKSGAYETLGCSDQLHSYGSGRSESFVQHYPDRAKAKWYAWSTISATINERRDDEGEDEHAGEQLAVLLEVHVEHGHQGELGGRQQQQ